MKEKRRSTRVPVYMKVIDETKETDFGFSYAKDISTTGIALDTKILLDEKLKLKKGDALKLKFKVPGGKLYISVEGKVARVEKTDIGNHIIGVDFIELEKDFKSEITVFVKEIKEGNMSLI